MRKLNLIILALVAFYLLATPLTLGQGGNPPASTKESGATSGRGMTAVEQTGKGGDGNAEQQITALSDQYVQAYLKGDTSFFEKYDADDATIIHSAGRLITKAEEIENFKSGDFKSGALKLESIDVRERKIRAYGDTVVVTGLASIKGTRNGEPFSFDVRDTWVWVKQNGDWKVVAFQATSAAPASQ
jgi:uncharacterized protein (TIGR02246 family)